MADLQALLSHALLAESRTSAAATVIPAAVHTVLTSGYHTRGDGGSAHYARAVTAPEHAGYFTSADGAVWVLVPHGPVSVKQFGAKGDGATDDWRSMQDAVDYAGYFSAISRGCYIPKGIYRTSDVLSVGYGVGYGPGDMVSVHLFGDSVHSDNGSPSCIKPTFNDRPAVNVQGSRHSLLENFAVIGVNHAWLYANYGSITDRLDVANWYGPNISAANNTRYAPYVGISIDAYAGTQPGTHYPTVTYPDWRDTIPAWPATVAQYGKNYSSYTTLRNVRVEGFCVGVADQPANVPDASNGDFVSLYDCHVNFNIVNYAICNGDARNNNVVNSRLHFAHTAIDTLTYGPGKGTLVGHCLGSSVDNVGRILNVSLANVVNSGIAAGYVFSGLYGEAVYSIGNYYVTPTALPLGGVYNGLVIDSFNLGFSIQGTEHTPAAYANGLGVAPLVMRNGTVSGTAGIFPVDGPLQPENVSMASTLAGGTPFTGAAGRVAAGFTCGFWATKAVGDVAISPPSYSSYFGADYSHRFITDDHDVAMDADAADATGYGTPIPWFTKHLTHNGVPFSPASNVDPLVLNRATYNLSSYSKSGSAFTLTVAMGFISDHYGSASEPAFAVSTGDIMRDDATGHLYFVSAAAPSGGNITLTLKRVTGIRWTGSAFAATGDLALTTGTLTFHNARRVYPCNSTPVQLTTTAGSSSATIKQVGSEAVADAFLLTPVRVGDYMICNNRAKLPEEGAFPQFAKVTAINTADGSVTFSTNARRTTPVPLPCPLFIRAAA